MKNYSYTFKGDKFDIDIVPHTNQKVYELQKDKRDLYIFVEMQNQNDDLVKIIYPIDKYNKELSLINKNLLIKFTLFSILAFFISILFAFYSLYPLQKSYEILKEFMKDIIHDINTPISAMKMNISLIDNKDEEIKSIEQSIDILQMLHRNLENYVNNKELLIKEYNIKDIILKQTEFFSSIYDYIKFDIDIDDDIILTDSFLISRVIYNLLNNACKYNIKNGYIKITYKNKVFSIQNSSHGIKHPSKVFNRFYKEHDRGLGIGLHIVAKILKQLNYKYTITQDNNNIVTITVTFK
jgi:two-component system OmpR family sensor kinase